VIKAVRYYLERHYSVFGDGAFLVDLQEVKTFREMLEKFSKKLFKKSFDDDF
jgi:hypothetical protein